MTEVDVFAIRVQRAALERKIARNRRLREKAETILERERGKMPALIEASEALGYSRTSFGELAGLSRVTISRIANKQASAA